MLGWPGLDHHPLCTLSAGELLIVAILPMNNRQFPKQAVKKTREQ
jgi:hypothetical protein